VGCKGGSRDLPGAASASSLGNRTIVVDECARRTSRTSSGRLCTATPWFALNQAWRALASIAGSEMPVFARRTRREWSVLHCLHRHVVGPSLTTSDRSPKTWAHAGARETREGPLPRGGHKSRPLRIDWGRRRQEEGGLAPARRSSYEEAGNRRSVPAGWQEGAWAHCPPRARQSRPAHGR
jgi:hypothetical protein